MFWVFINFMYSMLAFIHSVDHFASVLEIEIIIPFPDHYTNSADSHESSCSLSPFEMFFFLHENYSLEATVFERCKLTLQTMSYTFSLLFFNGTEYVCSIEQQWSGNTETYHLNLLKVNYPAVFIYCLVVVVLFLVTKQLSIFILVNIHV